MTPAVNPQSLTLDTALETCQPCPTNANCAICQENIKEKILADNLDDNEAVKTKVCGDKHFFHRVCITSWFKSNVPNLNSCPIDRKLLYGLYLVRQQDSNPPTYAEFPGHYVEEHGAREFIDPTNAHFANQGFSIFDNLFQEGAYGDYEELDHDSLTGPMRSINRGRAFEDVNDPEAVDPDFPSNPHLAEVCSDGIIEEIVSDSAGEMASNTTESAVQGSETQLIVSASSLGMPTPLNGPFEDVVESELDSEFRMSPELTEFLEATIMGLMPAHFCLF